MGGAEIGQICGGANAGPLLRALTLSYYTTANFDVAWAFGVDVPIRIVIQKQRSARKRYSDTDIENRKWPSILNRNEKVFFQYNADGSLEEALRRWPPPAHFRRRILPTRQSQLLKHSN